MFLFRIVVVIFAIQIMALTAFAQDQNMAVIDVQLQGDAEKYFSPDEKKFLSQAIRAQASQILGGSVNILSQANYKKLVRANSEGCNEAGCFAGFLAEIGVDLGVQPNVSFAFGSLNLTLEVADKKATISSRTLTAPATPEGKNELGKEAVVAAKELFIEVASRMGLLQEATEENQTIPTPDQVGTNLTIEFTDGPGAVMFDHKLACSYKEQCSKEVSNGIRIITASRDGYQDSTFTVAVPNGNNRYALALVSKAGVLTIRATDSEGGAVTAQVIVDGRNLGNTPWSGAVPLTAHSTVVRAEGYADVEVSARPEEGKKKSVKVTLEKNKPSIRKGMESIPGGCIQMGSTDGQGDEKPVHRVCLTAFKMDKTEVTRSAFNASQGPNPHENDGSCYVWDGKAWNQGILPGNFSGNFQPQVCVDWDQAKAYCESQGKRLPTEAEFEYANRAGTTTKWPCGNDESCLTRIAWYNNGLNQTHPVGQKQPNAWGLYDMTGNAWEWISDWYGDYGQDSSQDPQGTASGARRVSRGGSWYDGAQDLSSANRYRFEPFSRISNLGFRCAL
jgi:formylglycine-generating enzyme required for sulfatase activity